jgi:hypothetical protein
MGSTHSSVRSSGSKPFAVARALRGDAVRAGGARAWRAALLLVAIAPALAATAPAATLDLLPILTAGGTTVTLNPSNTYTLGVEHRVTASKTILGNGATIQAQGPLGATGSGVTLTLDNCVINGSDWSATVAGEGSHLVLRNNCRLSCSDPDGAGVYVEDSSLTAQASSITESKTGVNAVDSTTNLHGATITNCSFGALVTGGNLTVDQSSSLSSSGAGVGIGTSGGATVTVSGSSLSGFDIAVNLQQSTGVFHSITVTGCPFGIQAVGGSATVDQNSALTFLGSSSQVPVAVGSLEGASLVIRDSTVTGFGIAVGISAATPTRGTAEATDCRFLQNGVGAAVVTEGCDVLFSRCRVQDAVADGIYYSRSTGIVEDCEVIGSLNTGVTFWGCSEGAILRNTLVENSAHQGVAVVVDPDTDTPSLNVQILNNTLVNNAITNILIDAVSTAFLQGNLSLAAPVTGARLVGTQGVTLESSLMVGCQLGMDMSGGAGANIRLSSMQENSAGGLLIFDNSVLTLRQSSFWANNQSGGSDVWSIFINTGATLTASRCAFGPAGEKGLLNSAATAANLVGNYWAATDGPNLASEGGGSGAVLSRALNGSTNSYQPFLTQPPVECQIERSVSLPAGGEATWDSGLGVALDIDAKAASTALTGETAGVMRVNDTTGLDSLGLPGDALPGWLCVVWVSCPLRLNALNGRLDFQLSLPAGNYQLQRRTPSGAWANETTSYNSASGIMTYVPADVNQVNGTFVVTGSAPTPAPTSTPTPASTPTPGPSPTPGDGVGDIDSLVTCFYNTVLGRPPETGAVDAWCDGYFQYALSFDIDVRFIPREMGRLFFLSDEYAGRNRSDGEFITDCYRTFLTRDPNSTELNNWLSGEWNRAEAMTIFAESQEFAAFIQGLFPGMEGIATRNFVTTMYIGLLDRLVDQGGLMYWSGLFDAASDKRAMARQMARGVIGSEEFASKGPTNALRVTRLYRAFLGRFPNTSEATFWVGELDSGARTLDDLIDLFSASEEFTVRLGQFF